MNLALLEFNSTSKKHKRDLKRRDICCKGLKNLKCPLALLFKDGCDPVLLLMKFQLVDHLCDDLKTSVANN